MSAIQRQFMCPGCPAEIVTQNIARHPELNPSENGSVIFMALINPVNAVGLSVERGNTSLERILAGMNEDRSAWAPQHNPDQLYGDLTKLEITLTAVRCMLRGADGECPRVEAGVDDIFSTVSIHFGSGQ